MYSFPSKPPIPIYTSEHSGAAGPKGSQPFTITQSEGALVYEEDLLIPHRKAYYLLVFVKQNQGRHWVDMTSYERKNRTLYFTAPHQILVKEAPTPFWGTYLTFTNEFLTLQQNAALRELPLILNPHNGHELLLSDADWTFVEEMLAKLSAEYQRPGEWQHRMLTAYLTVLLTYLSRLYTEQFTGGELSADQLLLQTYRARIEESFRELHEVSAYAEQLHISAGHLSEVVKAQSGRPAIKHIHERLVLEARRLLFYTPLALKEIAFDLGFSDASYFNRFFKREVGVTPAEYRSSIRKMYH
ncbi:helix-turn-helix domain-containing protein [Hymenobacter cellulosivorans]|uniref:AraC family transcriptional regulator n=1 Tax=Hymenobacter cellulosivorans TaxID=2932249 RepID=A0ABY4F871_9BACT|nr:AraC family transcriptional regulator [Hymenobacter cellulosivorans]UOQ52217.1 AraC family transcriptional regulator [Hymenobacter cellulosivorans]